MKTERRHELQTNILADWLGHQIEQLRPYGTQITVGLVALAVLALAGVFFLNSNASSSGASWADYFAAYDAAISEQTPDPLAAVAQDHPGTLAALWANQTEADLTLARGIQMLYTDRSTARELLERAKAKYEIVSSAAGDRRELKQSALFGLAQVHESMSQVDEAKTFYQQVIDLAGDSARAKAARKRLAMLNDPDTVRFYNWFANQKPVPPSSNPLSGIPGMGGPGGGIPGTGIPGMGGPGGATPSLNFPQDFGSLSDLPESDFLNDAGGDPVTLPAGEDETPAEPAPQGPALNPPAADNAPEPASEPSADSTPDAESDSESTSESEPNPPSSEP